MRELVGNWFAPGNSTRHAARLSVQGTQYRLQVDGQVQREGELTDLDVSDPVGGIQRRILWPDGAMLETSDNDSVNTLLQSSGHRRRGSLRVHRMEGSLRWIVVALVVTLAAGVGFFRWGLPVLAERIAEALPVSAHEAVASGALELMDRLLFEPSLLSEVDQSAIRQRFDALQETQSQGDFRYTLHFRRMQDLPNAMALPGGDIVLTDAFVDLSEHPHEIDAVLLHEIGHVEQRHAMRQLVQASAVSVILALALGDTSGVAELITAVPGTLLQRGYSRSAEREADDFAFRHMVQAGIDPRYFASVITRLGAAAGRADEDTGSYLSTHPAIAERARRAVVYAQRHFDTLKPGTDPDKGQPR